MHVSFEFATVDQSQLSGMASSPPPPPGGEPPQSPSWGILPRKSKARHPNATGETHTATVPLDWPDPVDTTAQPQGSTGELPRKTMFDFSQASLRGIEALLRQSLHDNDSQQTPEAEGGDSQGSVRSSTAPLQPSLSDSAFLSLPRVGEYQVQADSDSDTEGKSAKSQTLASPASSLIPSATLSTGPAPTTDSFSLFQSILFLSTSSSGPALLVLPYMFSMSGWGASTIILFIVAALTILSSLLLVDSLSNLPGIGRGGRRMGLRDIVLSFLPQNPMIIFVALTSLFLMHETLLIGNILYSARLFDSLIASFFGCTLSLHLLPLPPKFFVVNLPLEGSLTDKMTDSFVLFPNPTSELSLGLLITVISLLPFTTLGLRPSTRYRVTSALIFLISLPLFLIGTISSGIVQRPPFSGTNTSSLLGVSLFCIPLQLLLPYWLPRRQPSVSPRIVIVTTTTILFFVFSFLGWVGSSYFMASALQNGGDVLSLFAGSTGKIALGILYFTLSIILSVSALLSPVPFLLASARIAAPFGPAESASGIAFSFVVPVIATILLYGGPAFPHFLSWWCLIPGSIALFLIPSLAFLESWRRRFPEVNSRLAPTDASDDGRGAYLFYRIKDRLALVQLSEGERYRLIAVLIIIVVPILVLIFGSINLASVR